MLDLRPVAAERARTKPALAGCLLAGGISAVMYARTLLPGLDLGDTASFQTTVTLPVIVPRHAYPLYFALGKLFVTFFGGSGPAYAMNLLSAAAGVAAIVAFGWVAWMLTGRVVAAFWSALLFAGSYTFWSQAIIAEVYTLEALFIALVLVAAIAWWRAPTGWRLSVMYAVYALSFGNHLGMILLAPALVWLLWAGRARATLDPFSPAGIALAAAIAATGALQYAWNFAGLWTLSSPRPPMSELMATFWFDVTKSDWRASLVGTVPMAQWHDRLAMYWWDLRQQYGLIGIAIAASGAAVIVRASTAVGLALALAYFVTFAFAFIYNVGDTHVFLLPSHQIVATFAAIGAAALLRGADRFRREMRWLLAAALLAIPAWRIADTWPAVDRSGDHRAGEYAVAALAGLTPQSSVYVGDLNWQVENAVGYELAVHQAQIPRVFSTQVLWHFPEFVERNRQLGREIVLTRPAAETIASAYGEMFPIRNDTREAADTWQKVTPVPHGAPYVLAILTPLPETVYNAAEVDDTAHALAGVELPRARYIVVAGISGMPPLVNKAANRPFRVDATLGGHRYEIRFESWLPADTMRRAGFGHVIVDGRHALTLERGASLGVFDLSGQLSRSANQGGSFALQPRYVIGVLR